MIIYIENPKVSTNKLLKYRKTAAYKITLQNSVAFLVISINNCTFDFFYATLNHEFLFYFGMWGQGIVVIQMYS